MNDRIESLLRHKTMDELDDAERAEVLEEMTLSEYDQLHRTLNVLHTLDADATPAPALRAQLLAHGRQKGYFHNPGGNWWQRRIPAWQAAAASLLFASAVYFFNAPQTAKPLEIPVEKIVFRSDTIFKTDTLWRRRVVVRYRYPDLIAPSAPAALLDTLPVETPPQAMHVPTGTPIGDTPALMEFLGGTNK
ncbi:MAG TPA: hypothetical protein PK228_17560 [Saprospiraceae bacterium]|nr:hypothetical protein [Saprospiraceae bacterium]